MKKFIFCIRDKKLGAYDNPMFKVEDKEHVVEQYARGLRLTSPEEAIRARDMSLYYLGEFDDVTGQFSLLDKEEKLIDFEDFVSRKEENDESKGN